MQSSPQLPTITELLLEVPQTTVRTLNATSIGVAFATVVGWLPSIAAALSIVWTSLSLYITIRKHFCKPKVNT